MAGGERAHDDCILNQWVALIPSRNCLSMRPLAITSIVANELKKQRACIELYFNFLCVYNHKYIWAIYVFKVLCSDNKKLPNGVGSEKVWKPVLLGIFKFQQFLTMAYYCCDLLENYCTKLVKNLFYVELLFWSSCSSQHQLLFYILWAIELPQ